MLKNESLDARQWIVLFIAGVMLCVIFFAFGLVIGKRSAGPTIATTASGTQGSWLPTESGLGQPASNTGHPPPSTSGQPSSQSGLVDLSSPQTGTSTPGAESTGNPSGPSSAINPDQASAPSVPDQTLGEPNRFYVRIGPYAKSEQAEELADTLSSKGLLSVEAKEEVSETGQRRFVVLVGPYVDRDTAAQRMNMLRNEHGVTNVSILGQR